MNHDAKAVANLLYKLARAERERLTNMQILKLVYIAHGYCLGLLGEALIADRIEAWEYGPVIPDLYHEYKGYGAEGIRNRLHTKTAPINDPDTPAYKVINTVFGTYGRLSGPELSALTHKQGTPWHQVWNPRKRRTLIPNDLIQTYYASFILKSEPPVQESIEAFQQAARLDDVQTFVGLIKETNWSEKSSEDLAQVIQLALNIDSPTAAEFLYREGVQLHPNSQGLTVYQKLFTPRARASRELPPNLTLKANREWLRSNRGQYSGQWIALRNGHLLASAASLKDLTQKLDSTSNTLLTRA